MTKRLVNPPRVLGVALLMAIAALVSGPRAAADTYRLTAMYEPTSPVDAGLGISLFNIAGFARGQSFTAEVSDHLSSIDLFLARDAAWPIDQIVVSIRAGTSFSNPVLATSSFSSALAPIGNVGEPISGAEFVNVDFAASGLSLVSGEVYTVWLSTTNPIEIAGWFGNSGNPYIGGTALTGVGNNTLPYSGDLGFRVEVVSPGSAVPDPDDDGVPNAMDNCPNAANLAQSDIDSDGAGDVCDSCPADALDQCNIAGSSAVEVPVDQGGVVATSDGHLSISVEPGDLGGDTTISVTQDPTVNFGVNLAIGFSADAGQALALYELEPDGLQFSSPVTLAIQADVTALEPSQRGAIDVYRYEDTNGDTIEDAFVPLTATCSVVEDPVGTFMAQCVVQLTHFSNYAIVAPRDTDGDGVFDSFEGEVDACRTQDATGFDVDENGCIDSFSGLSELVNKLIVEGVIDSQMANSLISKVNNAAQSATIDNICAAIKQLEALKSQVTAQTEKKISSAAATKVIKYANSVIANQRARLPSGATCG